MCQEIHKIGGRKFGFVNVPSLSCLPTVKASFGGGKCFEQVTPYMELHNKELSKLLQKLQMELKGFKYSQLPFESFMDQCMKYPSKYGNLHICTITNILLMKMYD